MSSSVKLISNYEYKKQFLSGLTKEVMFDNSDIQLYRIEHYLRNILIPVLPYRTTFSFILFVTRGHIKQYIESSEYLINEGGILIVRQGSITATLELSSDVEGYFLAFENKIIEDLQLRHGPTYIRSNKIFRKVNNIQISWINRLYGLLEEELQTSRTEHTGTAVLLFDTLYNKISQIDAEKNPHLKLGRKSQIAYEFKELIKEHHLDKKDISFYANKLSITENYLNKCIKEIIGKSAKSLVLETSVLYSQILLQDLSKNISTIAFELNYLSLAHFTSLFKKVAGMSPTTYRKMYCKYVAPQ